MVPCYFILEQVPSVADDEAFFQKVITVLLVWANPFNKNSLSFVEGSLTQIFSLWCPKKPSLTFMTKVHVSMLGATPRDYDFSWW